MNRGTDKQMQTDVQSAEKRPLEDLEESNCEYEVLDQSVPTMVTSASASPTTECTRSSTKIPWLRYKTYLVNCPSCWRFFADMEDLNEHLWKAHRVRPFLCPAHEVSCNRSFTCRPALNEHCEVDHANIRDWACAECPKICRTGGSLRLHLYHQHESGHFVCTWKDCSYWSQFRGNVIQHYNEEHLK